jgi:phytanoyl-CoA hydroxylase
MDDKMLKEAKKAFDQDGYVFLPGFLKIEEVEEIREKITGFIKETVPSMSAKQVFYEDSSNPETLKQLQDLQTFDPFFNEILVNSRFKEIAEYLLEDKVIGKNLEYFNKPPRIGKPTPPHQDGYYFMLKPSVAATMWLALETADEQNGCVKYVKGSQKKGMRPHGKTKTLGFSQQIVDFGTDDDLANEVSFPAKAGDLLIHHSLTIHRAGANNSDRSRKALGFIYFGESAKEDVEAKAAYQKKLHEERFSETQG